MALLNGLYHKSKHFNNMLQPTVRNSTGKFLTSKFKSKCSETNAIIMKGDKIFWIDNVVANRKGKVYAEKSSMYQTKLKHR